MIGAVVAAKMAGSSPGKREMDLLAIIFLMGGIVLIWGGLKNKNPVELLRASISGKPMPDAWSTPEPFYVGDILPDMPGMPSPGMPDWLTGKDQSSGYVPGNPDVPQGAMIWPTTSQRLTDRFGVTSALRSGPHDGLDIDGECGDGLVRWLWPGYYNGLRGWLRQPRSYKAFRRERIRNALLPLE